MEELARDKIVRTPVRTKSDTPDTSEIAINVFSESDPDDFNNQLILDHLENNSIVAHSNPVVVKCAPYLTNSGWKGVFPQEFYGHIDS